MNNKILIVTVAIVAFILGVAGGHFFTGAQAINSFSSASPVDHKVAQNFEMKKTHKSYEKMATGATEDASSANPKTEAVVSKGMDYFSLSTEFKKFQSKMDLEASKKFESVKLSENTNAHKKDYLLSKMDYFSTLKSAWFKATINNDDIGRAKLTFYMNFYPCNNHVDQKVKKSTLENSCFMIQSYSFLNDKWNQYSVSSTITYTQWKDDVAYVPVNMEDMGELPKETNILKAYIPLADDGGTISFLKYTNNKFEWGDGGELKWTATTDKEAAKFQKTVNDYSIARGDRLEQ